MRDVAVVDVALAGLGRAAGVGEILVEVLDQVSAPNEVAAGITMRERHDVVRFVSQQRQRDDQAFVALAAGDGPANQPLAKQLQDAIVRDAHEVHPGVDSKECIRGRLVELCNAQVARLKNRWKGR